MILSATDAYALKRFHVGLDWQNAACSPWLRLILDNLSSISTTKKKRTALADLNMEIFGPEIMLQLLRTDPNQPPKIDDDDTPELPAHVYLSPEQEAEAAKVGHWEREFVEWAGYTANETPLIFHQAAALFLGGLAIGRRVYVAAPWGEHIYPNLYCMTVGVSTYYRKTTSLRLAEKFARGAMWHMLMPEPGSPENFINMLAGLQDLNALRERDKERFTKAQPFAASRGLIRDELSGLFRSMGKDYMAGMKERIMQMYDCPDSLDFSSNSKGLVVVRNIAFSLMGSTTPAGLDGAITSTDWRDGNLARFLLATPEPNYHERPRPKEERSPDALIARLRKLHELLPNPPLPDALGSAPDTESWGISAPVWEPANRYSDALRQITAPGTFLDDRNRAAYGRHHVKALKIAIILACLDWADTQSTTTKPAVTPAHWYRAQQIAEVYRASIHRLLKDLSASSYMEFESKVRYQLGKSSEGLTRSTLLKKTVLTAKALDEVLAVLKESGDIEEIKLPTPGRTGTLYRFTALSENGGERST